MNSQEDKTGRDSGPRWSDWVTPAGAIVTILLTIVNAYTKGNIDQANAEIEKRRAAVDESRERVERYRFVFSTLSDASRKAAREQQLAVAITRLALSGSEATDLFSGLAVTPDSALGALGRTGVAQTQVERHRDPTTALSSERQGYQRLLQGDMAGAATSFEAAERAFPTYHQAYELGRYLRTSIRERAPSLAIYRKVFKDYSLYATPEEKRALSTFRLVLTSDTATSFPPAQFGSRVQVAFPALPDTMRYGGAGGYCVWASGDRAGCVSNNAPFALDSAKYNADSTEVWWWYEWNDAHRNPFTIHLLASRYRLEKE